MSFLQVEGGRHLSDCQSLQGGLEMAGVWMGGRALLQGGQGAFEQRGRRGVVGAPSVLT